MQGLGPELLKDEDSPFNIILAIIKLCYNTKMNCNDLGKNTVIKFGVNANVWWGNVAQEKLQ